MKEKKTKVKWLLLILSQSNFVSESGILSKPDLTRKGGLHIIKDYCT